MKTGIIGSGSMGSGIAQVAATAGHEVLLYDNNPDALKRAQAQLEKILARLVEKGKMKPKESDEIFGRVTFVDSMYAYKDAGLVIEAIVENLDVKKGVFEQVEDIVPHDCILATNTSSLSIASIASACKDPSRMIGIHFFNPAPLMKLVEVIPAVQTSPETRKRSNELIQSWGKTTVTAKDTPGFIVNRVARPFYGEALRILEEGLADAATIDWAMAEIGGFRMGPFTLMDYIGHDVNYTVTETVFQAFYYDPRYKPSFTQKRLMEAGYHSTDVTHAFFSHLHYDHCMDYPRLVLQRWDIGAGLVPDLQVVGPPPLARMTEQLFGDGGVFDPDITARDKHQGSIDIFEARGGVAPRLRPAPQVREVHPGDVVEGDGWRVTVGEASHVQPQLECYGFRLDSDEGSLCYSGDSGDVCPGIVDLAQGVDVLIHDAQYTEAEYLTHVGWGHSSMRQTTAFATLAEVGQLVSFHHDPSHSDSMLEEIAEKISTDENLRFKFFPGKEGVEFHVGRCC